MEASCSLAEHSKGFAFLWRPGQKFSVDDLNLLLQLRPKEIPLLLLLFPGFQRRQTLMLAVCLWCSKRKCCLLPRLLEKNTMKPSIADSTLLCYMQAKKNNNKKAQTNFVWKEVSNYFKSVSSFHDKSTLALLIYHFHRY